MVEGASRGSDRMAKDDSGTMSNFVSGAGGSPGGEELERAELDLECQVHTFTVLLWAVVFKGGFMGM